MKLAIWGHLPTDVAKEGSPEKIMQRCKRWGIDVYFAHVYPEHDVKHASYDSKLFAGGCTDLLGPLLAAGQREGVEVEPWLLPFDAAPLTTDRPGESERMFYTPLPGVSTGRLGRRRCASWGENRTRGLALLRDLIEGCGSRLTGIHMDAIRYVDTGRSLEGPCQCDACRSQYRRHVGRDPLTAEDLKSPGVLAKFLEFRARNIRSLVEEIRDITNRAGLKLSMAARAHYHDCALVEGQDWVEWAREGLIDCLCTMNYSTDRDEHHALVRGHVALLEGKAHAAHLDGLGKKSSAGENTAQALREHGADALAAGVDGLAVFHYAAMEDADFEVMKDLKEGG